MTWKNSKKNIFSCVLYVSPEQISKNNDFKIDFMSFQFSLTPLNKLKLNLGGWGVKFDRIYRSA